MSQVSSSGDLYNQAWLLHEDGRVMEAIAVLKDSIMLKKHYKSCELLSVCYQEVGEVSKALECLEQAYMLNERSSKTACMLAQLLLQAGDIYRSKTIVDKVLQNQKNYGPARRILEQIANLQE